MSFYEHDDFGFDDDGCIPPDHHHRPSVKLKMLAVVLGVTTLVATVLDPKEEGKPKAKEHVPVPAQQDSRPTFAPAVIRAIPDTNDVDPPPENNPYNLDAFPAN